MKKILTNEHFKKKLHLRSFFEKEWKNQIFIFDWDLGWSEF